MQPEFDYPVVKITSREQVQQEQTMHLLRLLVICPVLFYSAYRHTGWLRYAMAAIAVLATGYNAKKLLQE